MTKAMHQEKTKTTYSLRKRKKYLRHNRLNHCIILQIFIGHLEGVSRCKAFSFVVNQAFLILTIKNMYQYTSAV